MICIQQATSPPPRTTSPAAVTTAPSHPLSIPLVIPVARPTSPAPTPPTTISSSSNSDPASAASGFVLSGTAAQRSRAERSLLSLLERESARALSPPLAPSPSRSTSRPASRATSPSRGARDSVIFDVDLAALVERSIALQTSAPRSRRPPTPQAAQAPTRPNFQLANTYSHTNTNTLPRATNARSHPYRPRFSTSPASASAAGSQSALTDSDNSSGCPSECGCSVHASSVPNSGGMHLVANRPRRSTLPERMARPDLAPRQPVPPVPAVPSFPPTPSPPLPGNWGFGEGMSMRSVGVSMGKGQISGPNSGSSSGQAQPSTPNQNTRIQLQPPTPHIAAPQPRSPSPQWRPAVSGPKRAPSPAQPPPRASHAALAAATGMASNAPAPPLGPAFGYRAGATSPTPLRPTTPVASISSAGSRGPPPPRSNVGVSMVSVTNINVAPRSGHARHGSAGLPSSPGKTKPVLRATSLEHDTPSSWPTASAAGPLLSPPPLEVEAFDLDRAARRLRNTAGRVCFNEIALPPPGGEESDEEERVKRPRLGGRRWSLW